VKINMNEYKRTIKKMHLDMHLPYDSVKKFFYALIMLIATDYEEDSFTSIPLLGKFKIMKKDNSNYNFILDPDEELLKLLHQIDDKEQYDEIIKYLRKELTNIMNNIITDTEQENILY